MAPAHLAKFPDQAHTVGRLKPLRGVLCRGFESKATKPTGGSLNMTVHSMDREASEQAIGAPLTVIEEGSVLLTVPRRILDRFTCEIDKVSIP